MNILKFEKIEMPSASFGELSSLPPISPKLSLVEEEPPKEFFLEEDDELFLGYGEETYSYPYRHQDRYDRNLSPKKYECAILENDFLKATFFPCFGGKLWSLIDKKTGRELLFANDVVRPCNLGARNAWLSGGIEWNVGFKCHSPFTCSLINTAVTELEDGTPVLRFYYFERIRCVVVQMDFFLPEKSELLFGRVRITNPNDSVIPMYWWSNVGVREKDGDRVIVPADEAYTVNSQSNVIRIGIPVHNGIDVTYPTKNVTSSDFFWKTRGCKRNYIVQLDKNGYGLCETSTRKLKGKKLFVWGNSQGGHKWMNFLTADEKSGRYNEIQSGLAYTQYESIPMPPYTTWEFIDAYGAMQADAAKIHGEWGEARAEVETRFDSIVSVIELEELLEKTKKMAISPAKKVIHCVDGWGALEEYRRKSNGEKPLSKHLIFGEIGEEQRDFYNLLTRGTVGEHDVRSVPAAYMNQVEWTNLLEKACRNADRTNWYALYLLGTQRIIIGDYKKAKIYLKRSLQCAESAWANYAMAVAERNTGKRSSETAYMEKAYVLSKGDISVAKELFRCFYKNELSERAIEVFESANEQVRASERCRLYYAYALARVGRLNEAENILCGEDGNTYLVVPDVRECELTVTKLWVYIQERRGKTRKEMGEPPRDLDFRMFSEREGWI